MNIDYYLLTYTKRKSLVSMYGGPKNAYIECVLKITIEVQGSSLNCCFYFAITSRSMKSHEQPKQQLGFPGPRPSLATEFNFALLLSPKFSRCDQACSAIVNNEVKDATCEPRRVEWRCED